MIHIPATMWVISSQLMVQKEQGITDHTDVVFSGSVRPLGPLTKQRLSPDRKKHFRPWSPARNTYSVKFNGSHNVWFIWRDHDRIRGYGSHHIAWLIWYESSHLDQMIWLGWIPVFSWFLAQIVELENSIPRIPNSNQFPGNLKSKIHFSTFAWAFGYVSILG